MNIFITATFSKGNDTFHRNSCSDQTHKPGELATVVLDDATLMRVSTKR